MKKRTHFSKMKILLLLIFAPAILLAQETITGKVVVESTGEGAPFMNIIEEGTNNGTSSDIDGAFSITVSSLPVNLRVSALGFTEKVVNVTTAGDITITVSESSESLEEVVVTGLATSVKRSNAANAVASISSEELVGITPPQTLDGALAGKFTGALVSSNSGAPGGGLSVKLRGVTSVNGNVQPLYIIDGIFLDNSAIPGGLNAASGAAAGGSASNQDNPTNRVADINPDDIENIEILKGASAAAIYGSRAAAGVIIITTKRGKQGKTKFNFSQAVGFNQAINLLGQRSYDETKIRSIFSDAARADLEVQRFNDAIAQGGLTDYEDEVYGENGINLNTNFSVSGGNEKTTFFSGISHLREDGIVKNTGYEKTSLRLNIDHRVNENIKLTLSSNYVNSVADRSFFNNQNNGGVTIGYALTSTYPWAQLFPDGNGIYPSNPYAASNPLQTRDLVRNEETNDRFILGGTANITLYKNDNSNLRAVLRGGLDTYTFGTNAFFPRVLQFQSRAGDPNGLSIQGTTRNKNINYAGFLVYDYTTKNDLNFTTQIGFTNEIFDRNTILVTARDLVAQESNVDQSSSVVTEQTRIKQEDAGFFAQEEVNFQDKLIGTIGLRGDKSSNNGDANKLYYYPKASLAVNLHNFGLWESEVFNTVKLRVAYGEAGNFAPFGSLFVPFSSNIVDGFKGIFLENTLGDANLEPERQKELEIGTDLGFLNNKINLEFSYYVKRIDDLILNAAIEPSSGFVDRWLNGGELENYGFEVGLNAKPIETESFKWNAGINFWKNTSEVKSLDIPAFNLGAFGSGFGTFRLEEGASATQIVAEIGGELLEVGNSEPDFQFTFNNNFRYKDFELSFLWHWKKGGDNVNLSLLLTDSSGTSHDYDEIDLDPAGETGNGPYRLSQLGVGAPYVDDASYLRLRELGFYYNVPVKTLKSWTKGYITDMKFGFSGRNLVNIFDYNSYDPEVSNFGTNGISSGVEVSPFPSSKRYMFHLSVGF
ncbi:SusC/RagA family TonB-linked outer membrane protein [Aquimarina algiphila]|uniref:SusC/RagA family TonB-linked outer membrane protein n=1 Tax=Aquimarina algiphila TaxID=2047982 RepID=UPI00232FECA1|nr:SusC/RagA family TonB-linked outer membrane protein [Aquimarina algiphila]